jgi:serine/threonine-protein kinase
MSTPEHLRASLADRYRIERELGQGGMATVYLAQDLKHDRKVAIKVLREELAASLGADRFLREIHIAAQLQHPHILTLIDSGAAHGLMFYVMPYVEGETLRTKLVRDGELPVADAVRILREVADALAYAHVHGLVHRDVKPENIMLSGRHALVMDFGVAKAVSEATGRQSLTTVGVALGTPTYMAPEQASADPHVDHRADLYALGVIAYELLTGRPPFTGNTPQQVIAAHVTQAPDAVTRYRTAVPAPLADLVMRCLEKRPADRPQSAQLLLDRLEELATPSGGMTPAGTAPHRAVRRSRTAVYAVSGLPPVAALGGFWTWRRQAGPAAARGPMRLVVVPFENPGPASRSFTSNRRHPPRSTSSGLCSSPRCWATSGTTGSPRGSGTAIPTGSGRSSTGARRHSARDSRPGSSAAITTVTSCSSRRWWMPNSARVSLLDRSRATCRPIQRR